jgi:osmotically-inducible protein OsmY
MKPQPKEIVKKNVIEQLAWNDSVDANNIQVEVEGNTVILKGTVNSYSSKVEASRETMLVARKYDIDNQLKVEFLTETPQMTDNEIIENIQNILKWNENINPVNIRVDVENGMVTLSGSVSRSREKTRAEDIVSSAKGVVDVKNEIKVKPAAVRADDDIEKDIKRAYERNPLIDIDNVFVEVNKGVVTLSGSVASEPIWNEIHEKALYTNGVVDVVDELTIG